MVPKTPPPPCHRPNPQQPSVMSTHNPMWLRSRTSAASSAEPTAQGFSLPYVWPQDLNLRVGGWWTRITIVCSQNHVCSDHSRAKQAAPLRHWVVCTRLLI
jgi:hypothetical protein